MTRTSFQWDESVHGDGSDMDAFITSLSFKVPVVVNRSRIIRARPKFRTPWEVGITVDVDDDLIEQRHLEDWVDIAGRRIGIGDWRPEKSGEYGRFKMLSIQQA